VSKKELNRLKYLKIELLKRYEYYKDQLYFEDYEYILVDIYRVDVQMNLLNNKATHKIFVYLENINEKNNMRLSKDYKTYYNIEKLNGVTKDEFHEYFKQYYLMNKFNNVSDKQIIRTLRTFYKAK
jgi:transposase-like protein